MAPTRDCHIAECPKTANRKGQSEATCGIASWQATTPECVCQCQSANHGTVRQGGEQPQRIRQVKGVVYKLAGVYGNRSDAFNAMVDIRVGFRQQHPGQDYAAYEHAAFKQQATASQQKWAEVQAVEGRNVMGDVFLVWERSK